MSRLARFMVVAGVVLTCVCVTRAVDIQTVRVGNPGNPGELSGYDAGGSGPEAICGAVNYPYKIGKFEVTAGEYTEFLNAVANHVGCRQSLHTDLQ